MAVAQKRAQTITTTVGGTFNLPNNTVPGTATIFDGHTATKNQNVYGATGPFNVKFGTGHVNNLYFTGGNQAATTVTGLAGNDSMFLRGNAHGTYTVNMGTGQNTISLNNAFGVVAYNNTNAAATTYDTLDVSNVTTNFSALSLVATTGAVATTSGTIADVHTFRALNLGGGTSTVVLNNLDDTLTFGNGSATVTGGATGDDSYVFKNFTGTVNATQTITDAGGVNNLDFSATTTNLAVNLTSATAGNALLAGTGLGLGHSETVTWSGAGGMNGIMGGSGNDTFTVGNTAGIHSINGGTGTNTLVYTGSQGVTLDVRDHELSNVAGTTDITFHAINTYKLLGAGSNTFIGDGSTGVNIYAGNGTTLIDAGAGSAATIHSDMGGSTTVIVGDGYGAMNVTNTAGNGVLTIDGSSLTHAITAGLGVGTGSAQITDAQGSVSSVNWTASSTVTGFIGNDFATTVTGTGNYDFHITTGAGADTITASGTANSVISSGAGDDTITVGNGNNTIIFGGGNDTISAGSGNNSIYCGGGTSQETVTGGNNIIDFSNGGTHALITGAGSGAVGNTLQGFSTNNNWAVTVTDTMNGARGYLDLSNYNKADITWDDQQNLNGGNVADLKLTVDANHTILIHDYFDHSAATANGSAAGAGAIKTLHFADGDLLFAQVKALTTTAAFV
jgi:hypothetical protein